jgi:nitrogen regulatory protein P-II 1
LKKIEAFIRMSDLAVAQKALSDAGFPALSVESIKGYGRQQGRTDLYRGSTYAVNLLPKAKLEIIVTDDEVDDVVQCLVETLQTGEIGDGKLFISEVIDAIRIRTGERGEAALS